MNTISVRGTITSRTMVSPSSNTDRTISRSPGSMTLRCSRKSTRPRSSDLPASGPTVVPRPRVSTLPAATTIRGIGPRITPSG